MKSLFRFSPNAKDKTILPAIALVFAILGCIPVLMMLWVAVSSQFTRIYADNGTVVFDIYFWMRIALVPLSLICVSAFMINHNASSLAISSLAGCVTSLFGLYITAKEFIDKKVLADSMSIKSSYTQNIVDTSEKALIFLLAIAGFLYFSGHIKTNFPIILLSVISIITLGYSVISYASTYEVNAFDIICRSYCVPIVIAVVLLCLSCDTVIIPKRKPYQPRRMKNEKD